MAELSNMQKRIYEYIVACIQQQGYPPSVREIGEAVGLKSPSTVHFHLKHLEEAGMIEKGAGKGRAITLTAPAVPEDKVPIVGNVAAGSPISATLVSISRDRRIPRAISQESSRSGSVSKPFQPTVVRGFSK